MHLLLIRQGDAVGFEEPSAGKCFAKSDNFGERVEESPVQGYLDLSINHL